MPLPLPPVPLDPKTARLRAARIARDGANPPLLSRERARKVLGLSAELPFGKYRGDTLEEVLDRDPSYITWLLENTQVELSDDALIEYEARL